MESSTIKGVITGNAVHEADQHRGWFIGGFMTAEDPRCTSSVEVKWGIHPEGDRRSQWAEPSDTRTLSILISGRFCVLFPEGEIVLATQGDYVLWLPGVAHSWCAQFPSVIVTVRWKGE